MSIRWNCSACGLPLVNKDSEVGLISACPRCRHEELVPDGSEGQSNDPRERGAIEVMTTGEKVLANLGVWGLLVIVALVIVGVVWVMNMTFSAPDQMVKDGITSYGSAEKVKK